MREREYYSLHEAARKISGKPEASSEYWDVMGNIIHDAGKGKIKFIVLPAGIMGTPYNKEGKPLSGHKAKEITERYCFVPQGEAERYEATRARGDENPYLNKAIKADDSGNYWELSTRWDTHRIEMTRHTLHLFAKDMEAYQGEKAASQTELPAYLDPKQPTDCEPMAKFSKAERETMLKLIIGMAMDGYGYDPAKDRNKATGSNKGGITNILALKGISISDDTIRNFLTEAKKLLPPESQ